MLGNGLIASLDIPAHPFPAVSADAAGVVPLGRTAAPGWSELIFVISRSSFDFANGRVLGGGRIGSPHLMESVRAYHQLALDCLNPAEAALTPAIREQA